HVSQLLQPLGTPLRSLAALLTPFASLAVIVFFVLSGFVIGHTHQEEWNQRNVSTYLLRRLVRLYPIYVVALLVSFWVAKHSLVSSDFLLHLFFLQGTFAPVITSNGPLWSLHYEAVYYFLYLALWRFPNSWTWFAGLSFAGAVASVWFTFTPVKVLALFGFWLFG